MCVSASFKCFGPLLSAWFSASPVLVEQEGSDGSISGALAIARPVSSSSSSVEVLPWVSLCEVGINNTIATHI